MHVILKIHKDASSLKISFSKCHALWIEAYKKGIDQPGQIKCSQFSIKLLAVNFSDFTLDNSNRDKISYN